ncbi:hypothetical protein [Bacillus sp. RAR_GA_16]|uniref:hypothetical protein n=1 Tax=Bacillus sp. RAR_GA_16 TaxID=2876774 RepID=UPI001CCF2DB7|nr:hypothetical protein [Bacillus sp. RAR_GA_16]MCA0171823.1 hypothetical protein [Bacillus sp. RAR_GA_16]
MDNLIELLLNNIVFVIIAIGGIVSFFKRIGSEEDQNKKPPQTRRQAGVENEQTDSSINRTEESQGNKTDKVSAYQEALERISDRDKPKYDLEVQRSVRKQSNKKPRRVSLSKNDVRNGVLWSEILGPPRSKRPHSFNNRARFQRK